MEREMTREMTKEKNEKTVVLSAGTLTKNIVRNRKGDELGKIEDLMIDYEAGRVSYAVLSFGGFMGLGSKLFAIPWDLLEVDTDEKCFRLDLEKAVLEKAPGFDPDNWPQVITQEWLTVLYMHYDIPPYWS